MRRYRSLVRADLTATYARDLHKWIYIAPLMGVLIGLLITLLVKVILVWAWPPLLRAFLAHPAWIIPALGGGFLAAGLIMQYATPDPDMHSTEEIVYAYHQRQGEIDMRPFVPKLLAAIATVASGGSAALEGPSIYGGGALGSWLWARLRHFRVNLEPRDRRILLISGAAAGMSAVFRAPFTGVIFALEMPYKDDLAHEALMPSLIASVVAFATLAAFVGTQPLFDFVASGGYTRTDLFWSAVLGAICGLVAMPFAITFRRYREMMVHWKAPHWFKMTLGGLGTGVCGLAFVSMFPGKLIPLGPNYEAVGLILQHVHGALELVAFGFFKLAATLFSLGSGGVSAMFVPLFLSGGSFGRAFSLSVVHGGGTNLFAAVGMAAFIAAGYKTPLTAVVFVAEATGGHAYIVPVLIGAAVAYAVSGQASASGAQKVKEGITVEELTKIRVHDVMHREIATVEETWTLRQLSDAVAKGHRTYAAYPVLSQGRVVGTVALAALGRVPSHEWEQTQVGEILDPDFLNIAAESDLEEALSPLAAGNKHLLLVLSGRGDLEGVVGQKDILAALNAWVEQSEPPESVSASLSK